MPTIQTDAILHYNVGAFGVDGWAIPNPGDDPGTLNPRISQLTDVIGKNLFSMMTMRDVDLATPPRVNFLKDVHNLHIRLRQLLAAFTVPHNVDEFVPQHATPAGSIWRVWPVPYYHVRNAMIKEWCELALFCCTELFQHSENVKDADIGPRVQQLINSYFNRIYRSMSIQCFGKTREEVSVVGFELLQADFDAYNPDAFFTGTERVDTIPHLGMKFTEDMLAHLRDGILVTSLPAGLKPHPNTLFNIDQSWRTEAEIERVERGTAVEAGATGSHVEGGPAATAFADQQSKVMRSGGAVV